MTQAYFIQFFDITIFATIHNSSHCWQQGRIITMERDAIQEKTVKGDNKGYSEKKKTVHTLMTNTQYLNSRKALTNQGVY